MAFGDPKPYAKSQQLGGQRKKYRRTVASPKRWAAIIDAKTGPCRVCGKRGPVSHHHLVPRGGVWGGSDTEHNVAPLCGDGTSGCHGLVENHDKAAMRALVLSLTDDEYAYCVEKGGEQFFERRYGITYQSASSAPGTGASKGRAA